MSSNPVPSTLDGLIAELQVERYGPLQSARPEHVDSPAQVLARQRVLNEAMDSPVQGLAPVVPLRRKRRKAA